MIFLPVGPIAFVDPAHAGEPALIAELALGVIAERALIAEAIRNSVVAIDAGGRPLLARGLGIWHVVPFLAQVPAVLEAIGRLADVALVDLLGGGRARGECGEQEEDRQADRGHRVPCCKALSERARYSATSKRLVVALAQNAYSLPSQNPAAAWETIAAMPASQPLNAPTAADLERLAAIVGGAHAVTDPAAQVPYLTEWRDLYTGRTPIVLRPGSTAEVATILKFANERGIGVVPQGGNTGLVGGQIPSQPIQWDLHPSPRPVHRALYRLSAHHGRQWIMVPPGPVP